MSALSLIDEIWTDSQVQTLPEELTTVEKGVQTDPEEPNMNGMSQPEMEELGDFLSGHILQRLKCPCEYYEIWLSGAIHPIHIILRCLDIVSVLHVLHFRYHESMLTTSVYSAIPVTFCHEGHMACILCVLQAMRANSETGCFECRRHSALVTKTPLVRLSQIEHLVESLMNATSLEVDFDATGFHRLEWQKRCR